MIARFQIFSRPVAAQAAVFGKAILLFLLSGRCLAQVTTTPLQQRTTPRSSLPDPLAVRPLTPVFDLYPDSSLADFSYLLDAPAGVHGFVRQRGDHFYFDDGSRARFWGVTITQEHIDIPHARIDEIVDNLAHAGCNLVRFHSLDNRAAMQYGFIRRTIISDAPPYQNDTQHFDKEYFDRLDYWIAKLKQRGIYSYIVLRAFRNYREGDHVPNADNLPRGATPMANFDNRLIELQQKFAREVLFEHVNPYTKIPYGNDPAVALIEVFNEDSLFSRPATWQTMVEPYETEFRDLWTSYLATNYSTTGHLRAAWTDKNGRCALQPNEKIENGTVALPEMAANQDYDQAQNRSWIDALKSPQRRRDGVRFAMQLQSRYFSTMQQSLLAMGLKVPTIGVVAGISVPDTYSAAQEFGFTGENMYQEHPEFEPGRAWLPPAYYKNQNYLRSAGPYSTMPFITRYRWSDKPVAVREWATCWPNQYRASSMMEMAAYSKFQDLDAIIYFAYYTTGDFTRLGAFDLNNDPARWSLFGPAAHVFLSTGTVQTAQHCVELLYTPEDLLAYSSWVNDLNFLAYNHRVQNVSAKSADSLSRADLTIMSGRSWQPELVPQTRTFMYTAAEFATAEHKKLVPGDLWRKAGYPMTAIPAKNHRFYLSEDDSATTIIPEATCFPILELKSAGLLPIGEAIDHQFALGGFDPVRMNSVFGKLPLSSVPHFAAAMCQKLFSSKAPTGLSTGIWISDTGELIRNCAAGTLMIDTPTVQVVEGTLTTGTAIETPHKELKVVSQSPFAVISAIALDGNALESAQLIDLKMATFAENRKQLLEPAKIPSMKGTLVMSSEGGTPIITGGQKLENRCTSIYLSGKHLVDAYLENGTWELLLDKRTKKVYVWCDTVNADFELFTDQEPTTMRAYYNETPPDEARPVQRRFTYPGWAKYAEISLE